jgi:hypothetical protein
MAPEQAADREEAALVAATAAFFLSDLKLGMTGLLLLVVLLNYRRISSWPAGLRNEGGPL